MVRVLAADAHNIVRMGIKHLCMELGEFAVTGEAASAEEALAALAASDFDLVIVDADIPGRWQAKGSGGGASLVKAIRSRRVNLPVLVFSSDDDPATIRKVMSKGGCGFLGKDCDRDTLAAAMRKVSAGKNYLSPEIALNMVFEQLPEPIAGLRKRLSARELQILRLLARGMGINEIAEKLLISNRTVSTHKSRLMQKLNFRSNADLYYYAVENGLVENKA